MTHQPFGMRRRQAADSLGIGLDLLDTLIRQGRLRARKARGGRTIIVSVQSIHDYLGDKEATK